jgi:hypothetical protein
MSVLISGLGIKDEYYRNGWLVLLKANAERSMSDAKDGSCVVYFVQESGMGAIKIGATGNLKHRIDILRVSSPYEMRVLAQVPGDERLEKYVHHCFHSFRIRGEWYRSTPELLACIEELKEGRPLLSDFERSQVEALSKAWAAPFDERPKRKKPRRRERGAPRNRTVQALIDEALAQPEEPET